MTMKKQYLQWDKSWQSTTATNATQFGVLGQSMETKFDTAFNVGSKWKFMVSRG